MKKRQIGIAGLLVGQAIMLIKKDDTLRTKIQEAPGFLGKLKILSESWFHHNKELVEEIKKTNREETLQRVETDLTHDGETIKQWSNEQLQGDWTQKGHTTVRTIVENIPNKKTLADGFEKYKQDIVQWWNNL